MVRVRTRTWKKSHKVEFNRVQKNVRLDFGMCQTFSLKRSDPGGRFDGRCGWRWINVYRRTDLLVKHINFTIKFTKDGGN